MAKAMLKPKKATIKETVKIIHKTRFNGHDVGTIRDVSVDDYAIWKGLGYVEIYEGVPIDLEAGFKGNAGIDKDIGKSPLDRVDLDSPPDEDN